MFINYLRVFKRCENAQKCDFQLSLDLIEPLVLDNTAEAKVSKPKQHPFNVSRVVYAFISAPLTVNFTWHNHALIFYGFIGKKHTQYVRMFHHCLLVLKYACRNSVYCIRYDQMLARLHIVAALLSLFGRACDTVHCIAASRSFLPSIHRKPRGGYDDLLHIVPLLPPLA